MDFNEDLDRRAKIHDDSVNTKALWLRPKHSLNAKREAFGWICGNPILASSHQWPLRDGKPYDFLCQINCARIPKKIWKGLGPRKGWISVFFDPGSETQSFHTKIIYSSKWGEEIKPPASYIPPNLRHLTEKFPEYKFPNIAWELEAFTPKLENGTAVRPSYMIPEPFHEDGFLLSNPRNQPTDWDEMELLLDNAIHAFEKNTNHGSNIKKK